MAESNTSVRYNTLLEQLLIYLTSTFCTFVFIPHPLTIIILAISGIIFLLLQNSFVGIKTKPIVHIRIVFFWMIISLVLCFVFHDEWAPYSLIPSLIVQYIILNKLNRVLILQDKFLNQISDKEGITLSTYLRDDYLCVEELNILIENNKVLLIALGIINAVALVAFQFIQGTSLLKDIYILILFISILGHIIIYNMYLNETYYAFLGFKSILQRKRNILKSCGKIILISTLLGLALSSNKALIDITKFFNNKIEYENYVQPTPPEVSTKNFSEPEINLSEVYKDYPEPKINWELIEQIAKIIVIIFLCAALIYFLVVYVFTTHFIQFFREHTIYHLLYDLFSKIRDFFFELFHLSKQKDDPYATVTSTKFKKQMDLFFKNSKKSSKKKNELDRLTKQFMNLIEWGYKKDIKYKNTMAPFEYTQLLSKYSEKAIICGKLYEKALYSEELLSKEEENDFTTAIHSILRIK